MTTSTERMRLLRARRRGEAPPVQQCHDCGVALRNPFYAPWCSRCWRRTEAGRAWQRERIARQRAKRRAAEM